ncbi:glycosyltransferase family 4 protein [Ascidiimonas aurantiaca]|uniref:glycosyltransferase family 4 protein n=1 Tax=Ascidiimonas aurantiaca TaxID=1685432 RepID=UPI0030ED1582
MHIGFITSEYPCKNCTSWGGLATSIKNLCQALVKESVQVTIFLIQDTKKEVWTEDHIHIHSIAPPKSPLLNWYFRRKYYEKYINTKVTQLKIDILEAPDWTGLTAFIRLRAPLVIRMHGTDAYFCHLEGRRQKFKNYILEKKALQQADYLISVSAFTRKLTKKLFHLKKDVTVIHNGIDTSLFSLNHTSQTNPYLLLYFGTIIRKKGVLELASVFNKLVEENDLFRLQLIGRDSTDTFTGSSTLQMFYSLLSEKAKYRVTYTAPLPYSQIRSEIAKAGIVVLPSFAEAFPMTWLEAMAMEKPFISSNIGWAPEIMIQNITGIMINPKNHQEFKKAVIFMVTNQEQAKSYGKNARKRIEESFSLQATIKKNIDFYKTIVTKHT